MVMVEEASVIFFLQKKSQGTLSLETRKSGSEPAKRSLPSARVTVGGRGYPRPWSRS